MHTYSPPTFWFGRCQPWDFISVWRPLFHQSHSSDPSWVLLLLYPSTVLPKGLTDLCTSFLGHSPPPPPFAHTSDQSVSSDFTEDIKNGACTANVLTETRAQDSAPLALTSVWRRCRNIFNRFKKKKDKKKKTLLGGGEKSRHEFSCTRSSSSTICLQLGILCPPHPFWVTKNITKATWGEISGLFCLSPFRWRYKCCFGFHNPRGLCLQSKIHPTKSGNWITEPLQWVRSLMVNKRNEGSWGWGRGGDNEKVPF